MMYSLSFVKGFFVSAGLIVAIGAQNAFVLRQGMYKNYVFITASVCALIDCILISMGVFGLGAIISSSAILMCTLKWLGFGVLFHYGLLALKEMWGNSSLKNANYMQKKSLATVILSLLAVSLLNPHVYLDTMLLIGSVGAQYSSLFEKQLFIAGCCIASTSWFFALCFGASYFSAVLTRPSVWRIIHLFIAGIMFWLAIAMLF